jgi:hypothetical protein
MRTLDLKEMESLNGGDWWSCAGSIAGLAATIALTAGATAITAGGALVFIAGFYAGGIMTGVSCGQALAG